MRVSLAGGKFAVGSVSACVRQCLHPGAVSVLGLLLGDARSAAEEVLCVVQVTVRGHPAAGDCCE